MIVAVDTETETVLGQLPAWPDLSHPYLRILTKDGYVLVPTQSVRVVEIK